MTLIKNELLTSKELVILTVLTEKHIFLSFNEIRRKCKMTKKQLIVNLNLLLERDLLEKHPLSDNKYNIRVIGFNGKGP